MTWPIARAFLVPEPTIAQRIVRAKRTLRDENVPFEVPARAQLAERLASVFEVIYLIFDEVGRMDEARAEFERAALLTHNARQRELLLEHAAGCADGAA